MLRKNLLTCFHLVFIVEQSIWAAHFLNIEMRLSISYEWNITFAAAVAMMATARRSAPLHVNRYDMGNSRSPGLHSKGFESQDQSCCSPVCRPGRLQCPWSSDTVGGPQASAASPSLPLLEW